MIQLRPGCKVNLGLRVKSRRPDGFHDLESFFLPLAFPRDILRLEPGQGRGLRLECENADIPDNLIARAYEAFAARTGHAPGLAAYLRKGIPSGAGLGGGSSDAACFLAWLNSFCASPLSGEELLRLAGTLGADVPFFLVNLPARVQGKGEIIRPAAFRGAGFFLVLAWPDIRINTAWAFAALDESRREAEKNQNPAARAGTENILTKRDVGSKDFFLSGEAAATSPLDLDLHNDLELAVFGRHPGIRLLKDSLLDLGAARASMSGSGSSVYGIFQCLEKARNASRRLRATHRHVYFARLCNTGM